MDNAYEAADNVTYITGDHTMKFGYNLLRYGLNSTASAVGLTTSFSIFEHRKCGWYRIKPD